VSKKHFLQPWLLQLNALWHSKITKEISRNKGKKKEGERVIKLRRFSS